LAAGAGTRLRPLTLSRPKPLVPVVNTPNIGHILHSVAAAGIKEVGINLHLDPDQIKRYVGRGQPWNLNIRYSYEPKLRGTAGSLAPLRDFFKGDTFIVLSGDGVVDFTWPEILAFHRKKKSIATMILAKTDAKFDYGVVQLGSDSRVQAILEKPSWSDFCSPFVNTGFYIFEPEVLKYIPAKGEYDFARGLWPALIKNGLPVHGYVLKQYWCDIGNLKEYKRCHRDILENRANIPIAGEETKPGIWIGKNTRIAKGVKFTPPVIIGNDVIIQKNAKIDSYSVIGDRCQIGEKAQIGESILWEDVVVSKDVKVSGCVLADRTVLKESVAFYEGAVINITN